MFMNKSLRNILLLCGVVAFMGTFFSCWEGDWQYPVYRRVDCNVPKFYDDKQGSYKGIVFLQNTNSILDTISTFVEVKIGDYADKTFEIQGFPLGCFLQYLDETAYRKIPSGIKGKK